MWLTGPLTPDHKTIADFRKDNGTAIRKVCARFTRAKMDRRMAQIEESVARYLRQLDTADRHEPSEALKTKTTRLKEKIEKLKEEMQRLRVLKVQMLAHRTSRSP
jgi:rubrerythrin